MTTIKTEKPFTVDTPAHKVVSRIHDLERQLKSMPRGAEFPSEFTYGDRAAIKNELRVLYALRKKQKKYKPMPPKRPNVKRGL